MARYLLELSLLENQCVVFSPMQLAGAALCLARQVLQEPLTPEGEAAWYLASSIHVGRYVSRVTAGSGPAGGGTGDCWGHNELQMDGGTRLVLVILKNTVSSVVDLV